ncbi:uncharacterized protein LOC100893190 [Strongylocentrotus purpuratus]|uniref:Uncharacterized protein n=1 Tax=Strongylocentrotus purpuratus TaxID=7668 RepID=A0A7M7GGB2_STRPU|nr:uncharacterized protein LOC100893190 [Strongylocentrotus purpuratus]XP_011679390.1 uncharacterized protein LOC100893190 [Strongylocentrotus purpuratus]|eukprot:XP_003727107.1 PREDICTED: uncharacterized protein LOC100893190 [Strongylocentrotus purpuratus]
MAGAEEEAGLVSDADAGVRRAYRKRSESRKVSAPSVGTTAVRVQLNKLSEKDVADAKMASVFGDTTASTKTPMRVNPLYDKNGTVEVNASELRRKRLGSESGSTTNGSVTRLNQQPNGSVHTVSQNVPMGDPMGGPSPPPIAYGGNFQLRGDRDGPPKSSAGGPADQVTTHGKVMPARVQKNTLPRSYLPPTIPSASPFMTPRQSVTGLEPITPRPIDKAEVEHVMRQARIRRWWRCILLAIIAFLVFALVIILIVVFLAR